MTSYTDRDYKDAVRDAEPDLDELGPLCKVCDWPLELPESSADATWGWCENRDCPSYDEIVDIDDACSDCEDEAEIEAAIVAWQEDAALIMAGKFRMDF